MAIDEAIAEANQCPFGLAASIFTANVEAAKELAARIPAGHVSINDVLAPTAHPATPFGGRGASGWGVTQGAEGLLAMTVPQTVTVRKGTFRPHFDEAVKPDPATRSCCAVCCGGRTPADWVKSSAGCGRWCGGSGRRSDLRGGRRGHKEQALGVDTAQHCGLADSLPTSLPPPLLAIFL